MPPPPRRSTIFAACLALSPCAADAACGAATAELLMAEQQFCEYCEAWDTEIGVIYDKTSEGRQAPLRRYDIADPLPEGVTLDGRIRFTPTFVLLCDARESGRIEGYPGEDFFYPLLQRLIAGANNTEEPR